MGYEVKVIADSISEYGERMTTMQVRFPRFILPEFNTHRVFSRNFSSSRAIPVAKMVEQVRNDPAMPIHWGKNQPGMQADVELTGEDLSRAKARWMLAANMAAEHALNMQEVGAHKQIVNRILEPYLWVNGVVSSTDWDNFFELRCHKDAQPEIQKLACMMFDALAKSKPALLQHGEWHLPYIEETDRQAVHHYVMESEEPPAFASDEYHDLVFGYLKQISAARCCRVSYNKHDGTKAAIEDDIALCDRLVGARPLHASPFEHQATPDVLDADGEWAHEAMHGNLHAWIQQRKEIELFTWNIERSEL